MSLRSRHFFLCVALVFAPLAVAESAKPGVDPRVDTLLRHMADYLKSASEFSFHTEVNYDQVLESGQKILYGRRAEISMRRPDRLHILVNGDVINERLWYDGKSVVLLDLYDLGYVKIDVPPRIDDALDFMARKYGISSPVADVLYSDPYAIPTTATKSSLIADGRRYLSTPGSWPTSNVLAASRLRNCTSTTVPRRWRRHR